MQAGGLSGNTRWSVHAACWCSLFAVQLKTSSNISRKVLSFVYKIVGGTDLSRGEVYIEFLPRAEPNGAARAAIQQQLDALRAEQKVSIAAASQARDQYVQRIVKAVKQQLPGQKPDWPTPWPVPGANAAAAKALRDNCKERADPVLVDAICAMLEDTHRFRRVCSDKEVQALAAILTRKSPAVGVAAALTQTKQDDMKLSRLFDFIDRYASPYLMGHEAIRMGDEKAHLAARKTVDPLFGITQHPKYFVATFRDIKQQTVCLPAKARQMLERFVFMNMAGYDDKVQTADEILEQGVGMLKQLVGSGDSAERWDMGNAGIETKHLCDDQFFGALHMTYMQQRGKQRVPHSIELDIHNVEAGVRGLTGVAGDPCTLGGVPLQEDGINLNSEVRARVRQLEQDMKKPQDPYIAGRGPPCTRLEIVDKVAVARQYHRRDRREDREFSDDEQEVSCVQCLS